MMLLLHQRESREDMHIATPAKDPKGQPKARAAREPARAPEEAPSAAWRAYEGFLGMPVPVVLAALWAAGAAMLASGALVLVWAGWALARLAAGFV
jgi:hypothetical protein